ncbi:galactofuranose ABC transporter, permease protein YjfF [Grimontia sp. NTOU-MAR1]|uniref:galactofuranose ABC transporter, permease protein YjfF n=1 Tax=Grimontia sp. NTOU-MAR1 TaxID=3111011 RepID=UPI002DB6C808|nr:galactofuranose ABC transporter, permease protein YjfF [Grimontia sp. NTOU-MAR1]WRV99839.1 galactofuranose ABC transporter, permease protein YjfF [Grimontia sp. NTOU-MAR1]
MQAKFLPLIATIIVFVALYAFGGVMFDAFFSMRVFSNLFNDNAFLIVAAIGLTLVIISGGIDLSVGAMIACVGVSVAVMIEHFHFPPLLAFSVVLVCATLFGSLMGYLIANFDLPPFIVTLAGMFFLRGLALVISLESVPINHNFYDSISEFYIQLPGYGSITVSSLILLFVIMVFSVVAHYTPFGRNIYAIGGSENSSVLLGIPVRQTKVMVYATSSFLAALAGILFTFYTFSGYALSAMGLELDAIASAVIGGTLLSGGVGYIIGTLFGVLIQGTIQTIIIFDGTLNSWWTKIIIGVILFVFIFMQKIIASNTFTGMLKKVRS